MPARTDIRTGNKAKLTVFSEGHLPVGRALRFLSSLEHAYTLLLEFEASLPTGRVVTFAVQEEDDESLPQPNIERWRTAALNKFLSGEALNVPGPDALLIFGRVRVNSPGFWELLGKWNPLETIRKSLNDYHERRKDKEYRDDAEAQQLRLKNLILEAEAARAWTKALQEMGANEQQIQQALSRWVVSPLHEMNQASTYVVRSVEIERE